MHWQSFFNQSHPAFIGEITSYLIITGSSCEKSSIQEWTFHMILKKVTPMKEVGVTIRKNRSGCILNDEIINPHLSEIRVEPPHVYVKFIE
jgi:hypothetical protein